MNNHTFVKEALNFEASFVLRQNHNILRVRHWAKTRPVNNIGVIGKTIYRWFRLLSNLRIQIIWKKLIDQFSKINSHPEDG